jgi:hypothetical protein
MRFLSSSALPKAAQFTLAASCSAAETIYRSPGYSRSFWLFTNPVTGDTSAQQDPSGKCACREV